MSDNNTNQTTIQKGYQAPAATSLREGYAAPRPVMPNRAVPTTARPVSAVQPPQK